MFVGVRILNSKQSHYKLKEKLWDNTLISFLAKVKIRRSAVLMFVR